MTYSFLNLFFNSKIFDFLPSILVKKIFKISKIFFCESNLQELPKNNHPLQIDYEKELKRFEIFSKNKIKPFISYSHLLDVLKIYSYENKKIIFYDFGANTLELFCYLSDQIDNLEYYYYDQSENLFITEKIKNEKKINKLNIDIQFDKGNNLDFLYFGSVIQYLQNYRSLLSNFFGKTKYIIIAQTPFFSNNKNSKDLVAKQLNLHPIINYLYLINFDNFINFMKLNNYILISKTFNRVTKFVNFKNFNKQYKELDMYDLIFQYDVK